MPTNEPELRRSVEGGLFPLGRKRITFVFAITGVKRRAKANGKSEVKIEAKLSSELKEEKKKEEKNIQEVSNE